MKGFNQKGGAEFESYGENMNIVKEMVDNDTLGYVSKFYTSLSNPVSGKISVEYVPDFWKALKKIKTQRKSIIATKIKIVNQDHLSQNTCSCSEPGNIICDTNGANKYGEHAVSLFKHTVNGKISIFDPNGVFKAADDTWLYKSKDGKKILDSAGFTGTYSGFNIDLPKFKGVQFYCSATDGTHVNDCGYCMFYNYICMREVIAIHDGGSKKYINTIMREISDIRSPSGEEPSKLHEAFPKGDDIKLKSELIIDSVFGTK